MKKSAVLLFALATCLTFIKITGQITPAEAGYIDVTDNGVVNDGVTDVTIALQAVIDLAISQHKGIYLPPGQYLVSNTLTLANVGHIVLSGSGIDTSERSVIVLAENSSGFSDPASPKLIVHFEGLNGGKYTDTYDRQIRSIDIKVKPGNSGAVGLKLRGAEGCGIYDVHVDLTESGYIGIWGIPASGGSTHQISVKGGEIGVCLYEWPEFTKGGTQPGPVITNGYFEGQTSSAIEGKVRGALALTGCEFVLNPGIAAFYLKPDYKSGGFVMAMDCKIEYTAYDANNQVVPNQSRSVYFNNVYVKNAEKISGSPATLQANGADWVWFKEAAMSLATKNMEDGIYIDNQLIGVQTTWTAREDGIEPPAEFMQKHKWSIDGSFPDFNSPGAVNIKSFESHKEGDDWAPAIQYAVNNHEIVFFPPGDYPCGKTITLKPNSKLLGIIHGWSNIYGDDPAPNGGRFNGATDPYLEQYPLFETADDPNANTILAHLAINRKTSVQYANNTEPIAVYPLKWMAGENSVIRHVYFVPASPHNFPSYGIPHSGEQILLNLHLKQTDTPMNAGDYIFTTDCEAVFADRSIPSKFIVESIAGKTRLMLRSHLENETQTLNSNIRIKKNGTFDISSVTFCNADFNPYVTHQVKFTATINGEKQVLLYDFDADNKPNPREVLIKKELNLENVSELEITSPIAIGFSEFAFSDTTIRFDDLTGEDIDYVCQRSTMGYRHYPLMSLLTPNVIVTNHGGGKWYNMFQHGGGGYLPDVPFFSIENNTSPLRIYHCHIQGHTNDTRLMMKGADNVIIYGHKGETCGNSIVAYDSKNIAVLGMAGMTNPFQGHNQTRFIRCEDYVIGGFAEEWELNGDARLVKTECSDPLVKNNANLFDSFYGMDINDSVYTHDRLHRPVMFKVGNPDFSGTGCSNTRLLNINNGTGGGNVCVGYERTIKAPYMPCSEFIKWSGNSDYLTDSLSAETTITMPDNDVILTALYSDKPVYSLNIEKGTSDMTEGCSDTRISIFADAPVGDSIFGWWSGDSIYLDNPEMEQTMVSMPESDIHLIANYISLRQPYKIHTIPGKIEIEDFDFGGQNISYNDDEIRNGDENYRGDEMVDIITESKASNGYALSWIYPGEWIDYSISHTEAGKYDIRINYASGANSVGDISVYLGQTLIGTFDAIKNTGGWSKFEVIELRSIELSEADDIQHLRLEFTGEVSNFILDYFEFVPSAVVSVNEKSINSNLKFNVYPNPVTRGVINIGVNNIREFNKLLITINSIDGRQVLKEVLYPSIGGDAVLQVSDLENGPYILTIHTIEGQKSFEITIQNK